MVGSVRCLLLQQHSLSSAALSAWSTDKGPTNAAQLKAGYYFHEEWAVEYNFLQYSNTNNAAFDNIQFVNSAAPFIRRPLSSHSLFLIYSPFYGKINTFNKIYYFDVSFGIGTGTFTAESNLETATIINQNEFVKETLTPILLKVNTKFHINKSLHLGVEFLSTNFEARSDPDILHHGPHERPVRFLPNWPCRWT